MSLETIIKNNGKGIMLLSMSVKVNVPISNLSARGSNIEPSELTPKELLFLNLS